MYEPRHTVIQPVRNPVSDAASHAILGIDFIVTKDEASAARRPWKPGRNVLEFEAQFRDGRDA